MRSVSSSVLTCQIFTYTVNEMLHNIYLYMEHLQTEINLSRVYTNTISANKPYDHITSSRNTITYFATISHNIRVISLFVCNYGLTTDGLLLSSLFDLFSQYDYLLLLLLLLCNWHPWCKYGHICQMITFLERGKIFVDNFFISI